MKKNVKEELKFWRNNINIYNGYTFKPRLLTNCLLFTDVIEEGYDEFVLKHLNKEVYSSIGSSKLHTQNLAIGTFNIRTRFNIKLVPQWIPREQNYVADFYSRMNNYIDN